MADAVKKISVRATRRGQKPDRSWAVEGETFTIPEALFSERWMVRVEAEPAGMTAESLKEMTVKELKAMAKDMGLEGYSKLNEDALISLLLSAQD